MNERARESDATRVELQNVQDQLTSRVEDAESKLRRAEHDHNLDLESALIKLDEEQQRFVFITTSFNCSATMYHQMFEFHYLSLELDTGIEKGHTQSLNRAGPGLKTHRAPCFDRYRTKGVRIHFTKI